jgi:NADPH:quinone reductase-like Zn-dependent oxidoreductase
MMGGMGRTFDGGYAQYTCVPAELVIPFDSDLDWATLGAVPEMLQTAYGSLTAALDAQPGQTLLIRGGTTSIGMAAAVLAKDRGMTVLSTTRRPERLDALRAVGVDHPLVDDGEVVEDWYPMDYIPNGVRLTAYSREAADLPADVLQSFLDGVAAGKLVVVT